MGDPTARQRPPTFALVTGGGTAGHVQPALAVAEALVARGHEPATIRFVGSRRGMEGRLVPEAGFEVTLLPGRGIQRRLTLENLGALGGLVVALVLATAIVLRRRPRVVVTVGGYAGLPGALAAVALRVPLVVVSFDAAPGASNRLVARFARTCAVAFEAQLAPEPGPHRGAAAPCRAGRRPLARRAQHRTRRPRDSRRSLPARRGGRLARRSPAQRRRRWARQGLGLARRRHDLPRCGRAEPRALTAEAAELGLGPQAAGEGGLDYRLVGYERRMPELLAACDLAVCRAGASTVAELAAIGTPSVLVPLPGAPNDHQTRNAEALAEPGAAVLLADARLHARTARRSSSDRCSPNRTASLR